MPAQQETHIISRTPDSEHTFEDFFTALAMRRLLHRTALYRIVEHLGCLNFTEQQELDIYAAYDNKHRPRLDSNGKPLSLPMPPLLRTGDDLKDPFSADGLTLASSDNHSVGGHPARVITTEPDTVRIRIEEDTPAPTNDESVGSVWGSYQCRSPRDPALISKGAMALLTSYDASSGKLKAYSEVRLKVAWASIALSMYDGAFIGQPTLHNALRFTSVPADFIGQIVRFDHNRREKRIKYAS